MKNEKITDLEISNIILEYKDGEKELNLRKSRIEIDKNLKGKINFTITNLKYFDYILKFNIKYNEENQERNKKIKIKIKFKKYRSFYWWEVIMGI